MSAFEVEAQSLSALSRVSGRAGGQGGQGQKDDGVFGALMSGLDAGTETQRGVDGSAAVLDGAAAEEGASRSELAGRRPAFSRDLLVSLFSDANLTAEGEAARLAAEAEQAPAGADEDTLAERLVARHKQNVKGAHAGRAREAEATVAAKVHGSAHPARAEDASGEETADGEVRTAPSAEAVTRTIPDAAVPVAPPAPVRDGAAAPAEAEADAATLQARSSAEAVTEALANAEGEPTPVRVSVLSQETHFAPVGAGRVGAPAFSVPQEGAETAPRTEGEAPAEADAREEPDAGRSTLERAAARHAQERAETRLSERQAPAAAAQAADEGAGNEAAGAEGTGGTTLGGTTGLAQGLTLSNLRQVSSAIGAELARMGSTAPGQTPDAPRQGGGPLRLLDIQLHPADLGTVTVRMRMSDSGLEVRLSADNAETARMLRNDHVKLADMLAAEGVEEARVSVVDAADQAGAWARFETLPRQTSLQFGAEGGEENPASDQGAGDRSSRKDHDEDEAASGGGHSRRDER